MALIPELVDSAARHGAADREKIFGALRAAARNQSSLLRAISDHTEIDENGYYI